MMNKFEHNRLWLSIIFNNTIIYLYKRYRKMLTWDETRLTLSKLKIYSYAIFVIEEGYCFWDYIDET